MTTDLNSIKQSLQNCEEISLPFKFPTKCWIKYITLKDDDEFFYEGGEFIKMGDHKIFINENGRQKCIPTCIRTDDGDIIYKSRFFINPNNSPCDSNLVKHTKIIESQQSVIKRNAKHIQLLESRINQLTDDNYQIRIELQDNIELVKELKTNEKKYKLLLSKYV